MDLSQVEVYNKEVAEQRAQRDKDYAEYEAAGRIWGLVPRERITKIKFPRVKKEIIDGYLSMDDMSTTVSDVLDGYGIDGAIPSSYLKPVIPGSKICGPAVTIRNIPVRKTPTQGAHDHDFIAMSTRDIYYIGEPGDVLVSDFGGNLDVSNMGRAAPWARTAASRATSSTAAAGMCPPSGIITTPSSPAAPPRSPANTAWSAWR